MIDKLTAAERTYKELQLRMSDPEVAANATEFQKVRCQNCTEPFSARLV
jgi:peptide chain release factor 1